MEITSEKLITELLEITCENQNMVALLIKKPIQDLNWKSNPKSWSILECIEHLNKYGDFYIPEITNRIASSKHPASKLFKSNWLGSYFSKSVAYKEQLNKMKTFKAMNPLNSTLTIQTLKKFITQQDQIIELLDKAKNVNLDKTKTAISISKIIKLRLGDTFRVLIYHNQRHIKQAEKIVLRNSTNSSMS